MYHTGLERDFANVSTVTVLDFLTLSESMYAKPATNFQRILLENVLAAARSISTTSSIPNTVREIHYAGNVYLVPIPKISELVAWSTNTSTPIHIPQEPTGERSLWLHYLNSLRLSILTPTPSFHLLKGINVC